MSAATKMTSKGQVVIPKAVRQRLRWKPGQRLKVEEGKDGSLRLSPADDFEALLDEVIGSAKGVDMLSGLEADHREEIARDERRLRRGR